MGDDLGIFLVARCDWWRDDGCCSLVQPCVGQSYYRPIVNNGSHSEQETCHVKLAELPLPWGLRFRWHSVTSARSELLFIFKLFLTTSVCILNIGALSIWTWHATAGIPWHAAADTPQAMSAWKLNPSKVRVIEFLRRALLSFNGEFKWSLALILYLTLCRSGRSCNHRPFYAPIKSATT